MNRKKSKIIFFVMIIFLLGPPSIFAQEKFLGRRGHLTPEQRGRFIMEEVQKRGKTLAEHALLTMIIADSSGKQRERTLEIWNKYDVEEKCKNLIKFTGPQMVKNTALLTLERGAGEDNQWLFLPILGKSKRIAPQAKTNEFVGTDFTFEDLSTENLDDFLYEYKGEKKIENFPCFVIEALPIAQRLKTTGYGKRIIYVRKDIFFPIETYYYDKNMNFYKKKKASQLTNYQGENWRADRTEMIKIKDSKSTVLLTRERKLHQELDDFLFTQRELTKEY